MPKTIEKVQFPPRLEQKKKVAAYARVSSGKDAMLHSLSAQVSYYAALIQSHDDWQYAGVYSDEAQTGTRDDREDFQRLLADCRAGRIQMVITKSVSRFARNTVTLLRFVQELKSLGVDVFFEEQNIHTMSAEGELMMTILASYAQEESRSASENQKWRVRHGFENGELMNLRHLFGYDIDRDGVRINDAEAELVREAFRRFLDGESMNAIARWLNEGGHYGRFGGKWTGTHIRELLSNEKYAGNALLQKTYVNNHLEKKKLPNRGELPMYYAEETHAAIVDMDTFNRAQVRLAMIHEKTAGREVPKRSAFSGIIVCARCGKTYRRIKNNGHHAWNCVTFTKMGKRFCSGGQIREEVLYSVAADALGLDAFDEAVFHDRIASVTAAEGHTLVFHFRDGTKVSRPWRNPSRTESWTPEMKEKARQRTLARRGAEKCQK